MRKPFEYKNFLEEKDNTQEKINKIKNAIELTIAFFI